MNTKLLYFSVDGFYYYSVLAGGKCSASAYDVVTD